LARSNPCGKRRDALVALSDLFGIAKGAAGVAGLRQGTDGLGVIAGTAKARKQLFGYSDEPGTPPFKITVRHAEWNYIFFANGGRERFVSSGRAPE
jgi:choline-sulfatase